jgi:hypothetical protein
VSGDTEARLRELLRELYDGDACNCNADMGEPHEDECLQTRIEAALEAS